MRNYIGCDVVKWKPSKLCRTRTDIILHRLPSLLSIAQLPGSAPIAILLLSTLLKAFYLNFHSVFSVSISTAYVSMGHRYGFSVGSDFWFTHLPILLVHCRLLRTLVRFAWHGSSCSCLSWALSGFRCFLLRRSIPMKVRTHNWSRIVEYPPLSKFPLERKGETEKGRRERI